MARTLSLRFENYKFDKFDQAFLINNIFNHYSPADARLLNEVRQYFATMSNHSDAYILFAASHDHLVTSETYRFNLNYRADKKLGESLDILAAQITRHDDIGNIPGVKTSDKDAVVASYEASVANASMGSVDYRRGISSFSPVLRELVKHAQSIYGAGDNAHGKDQYVFVLPEADGKITWIHITLGKPAEQAAAEIDGDLDDVTAAIAADPKVDPYTKLPR